MPTMLLACVAIYSIPAEKPVPGASRFVGDFAIETCHQSDTSGVGKFIGGAAAVGMVITGIMWCART